MSTNNKALLSLSAFKRCEEENTIEYGVYPQDLVNLTPEEIEKLEEVEGTPYLTNGEKFFYYLKEKKKWFEVKPLRWKAAQKVEGCYLFTSEKSLDALEYKQGDEHPETYDDHRIKVFLNEELFPIAFLDGGVHLIENPEFKTKIGFLTVRQVFKNKESLLFHKNEDIICPATDYAKARGNNKVGEKDSYYVLNSDDFVFHMAIGEFVTYYEKDPYNPYSGMSGYYAIRPTIWMKLD